MAPKDIIIIGGSLTALLHGTALSHLGHNIHILERSPYHHANHHPESHQAGIGAAGHVLQFLEKYDTLPDQPLGIPSECLQTLDMRGRLKLLLKARRVLTSWDALFWRLRVGFDGCGGGYFDDGGGEGEGEGGEGRGKVVYEGGRRVRGVQVRREKVVVCVEGEGVEGEGVREMEMQADMVIGADGTNSIVRRSFLKGEEEVRPRYSGYVAWRGVVPEGEVSEEARRIFQHNVTYFLLEGEHVIVYHIPGTKGSIKEGERVLNFCWYSNRSPESLASLTTDTEGKQHHITVPRGKVRQEAWTEQCSHGSSLLPEPYKEVMHKITEPFLQVIMDYCSPRASFHDGKVLLVGDARTLLRPHIAFSTNQAAFDCQGVGKLVKGEITAAEWEEEVVQFSQLHWRRSIWFGEWFQRPLYASIFSGVRYWIAAASYAWGERRR